MGARQKIHKGKTWRPLAAVSLFLLLIFLLLGFCFSQRILFNENNAYEHLEYMVKLGPRVSDSLALRAAEKYISTHLEKYRFTVKEMPFEADTPSGKVPMKNILAMRPGRSETVLVLAAHYETKKFSDFSFVGANDGASGTAVLLELARVLPEKTGNLSLWLAFFDGEESFGTWSDRDGLYGSRNFVKVLGQRGDLRKIEAMILLDMVGDRKLNITRDCNSTPWLRKLMIETGRELKIEAYLKGRETGIDDDHIPFLMAGVPALDVIDMDYAYWHTKDDTLDHVSKESLGIVGSLVERMIEKLDRASRQK
jgi:glutaminyl-peptide cyclotransferase